MSLRGVGDSRSLAIGSMMVLSTCSSRPSGNFSALVVVEATKQTETKEFRAKVSKNGEKFEIDHLALKHSGLFFDLILIVGLTDQERAYGSL